MNRDLYAELQITESYMIDYAAKLNRAEQILKHIIEDYEDLDSHKVTQISINEAKRFLGLMK